jgi:hypothetical protein
MTRRGACARPHTNPSLNQKKEMPMPQEQKQPYVEPTLEKREQLAEVTELTKITGPEP